MSAITQPTDPTEDCNELSTQNGRATAPVTELEVDVSTRDDAPKTTSRSGRVLKPSGKQKALDDDRKARDASKQPSNVDRIKGNVLSEQAAACNFSSNASMKKHFPPHRGKGTLDIPQILLSRRHSSMTKAKELQEWRLLTQGQQLQRIESISIMQQREEQAADDACEAIDREGENATVTGTRRRSNGGKQPPAATQKKKRKKTKDRTQEQLEESAKLKRARDDRRNQKRKDQRAEERAARLQNDSISGLLVDSQQAAATSASAKTLTQSKERTLDTRPSNPAQLNDKTARRLQKSAVTTSMKFSEKNAINENGAATYGTNLLNTTAIIALNNTGHLRTRRLGGQSKRNSTDVDQAPPPTIAIAMHGGKAAWDQIVLELAKAGALDAARPHFTESADDEQPDSNLKFLGSIKETDAHYKELEEPRKRAPKVLTMDEVAMNDGSAILTETRPLLPMN